MKRVKKLGVLLGVLAVVCIATFALSHYEEKQETIKNSDAVILEIPTDSVTSLSWEYEEGSGLGFQKGENGWLYTEEETFPVSEDAILRILSHFESFGVSFLIENVEDYSQYGLDDPECTLHIGTEDASYHIKLGGFSTMDAQRYVEIGDGNVYLVREDPMDFVSASLSDMIQNDVIPGFETIVDIRFEGNENYIIQRLEDTNYSYNKQDVYFTQKNGHYLPLDKTAVTTYLNTIAALDLTSYVTYNATEETLASYGLDTPELSITVNYTHSGEDSDAEPIAGTCLIHIGRNPEELAAAQEAEARGDTPEAVSMYVRVGDSSIVYSLNSVDYGILSSASYNDLRHKEVFWADFADVTQIQITLEDAQHTLISGRNEEDEPVWYYQDQDQSIAAGDASSETTAETASAEEADPIDLGKFETALDALFANSFTTEAPTEKEEIRLTLYLDQENFPQVTLALYRYNGTECLAVVDGESVSLVSRSAVMDLVETVQTIVLN